MNRIRLAMTFAAALAALALAGCEGIAIDAKDFAIKVTDTRLSGKMVISIADGLSRSLAPAIGMSPASYLVTGSGPAGTSFTRTLAGESSATIADLLPGDWSVVVEAKNSAGAFIGVGSGTTKVERDKNSVLAITVKPYEGVGTLSLGITWTQADVAAPSVEASLKPTGTGSERALPFTLAAGGATFSASDVATGYYTLSLVVKNAGTVVAGAVETVRIVKDQTTSGQFSFNEITRLSGSLTLNVSSELGEPLAVSISGASAMKFTNATMSLSASTSNYTGSPAYTWYVNGVSAGTGAAFVFNATYPKGSYRIDAVAVSSDGKRAGSSSVTVKVEVPPDTEGPAGSLEINGGAASTYSEKLSLAISATDPSGVTEMYVSPSGSFSDGAWVPYATSLELDLSSTYSSTSAATITVHVKFKDGYGNESAGQSDSIELRRTVVDANISTDTTWSAANGPYVVTKSIMVNAGATLTIAEGASVIYGGDYQILVKGALNVAGTQANPVTFDRGTTIPSVTRMIIFKYTNLSLSSIVYANMRNAGMAIQLADESEFTQDSPKNSGSLVLDHLGLSNSGLLTAGYSTGAILVVKNSTIADSTVQGRYPRTEPITLDTCTITNSNIRSDSYNSGITVTKSTLNGSRFYIGCSPANMSIDQSSLVDCSFSEGGGSPVSGPLSITKSSFVDSSINLPVINATIVDSTFSYGSGYTQGVGVTIGCGSMSYSRMTGNGNVLALKVTRYSGYSAGGSFTLSYSDISGARTGLQIGTSGSGGTYVVSNSNLYNNSLANLENLSGAPVTATGNYWGSSDDAVVQAKILDGIDGDYGVVSYSPFSSSALSGVGPR